MTESNPLQQNVILYVFKVVHMLARMQMHSTQQPYSSYTVHIKK